MPFNPELPNASEKQESVPDFFDWEKERNRLSRELETLNDPSSLLEYLHNFPRDHMESEHWDDYLEWVNDHSDTLLKLASSDIPDVADLAVMVLSDTHAFLEERDLEHQFTEKTDQLRKKVLDFFRTHLSLFTADEKASSYRFGLRVQTLSKIAWLCQDRDSAIGSTAQLLGLEALKRGWTQQDKKYGKNINHPDLEFDIDNIVEGLDLQDVNIAAFEIAEKSGIALDLRKERLPEATRREKAVAHRQHLSQWLAAVTELEGYAEGSPRELQQQFGIKNFHHFPTELLKRQYELRNTDIPYGVVIAAQFDHNDAFNHVGSVSVLKSLDEQLTQLGMHARAIEVGSPRELATRLLSLDSRYGDKHKISFALVRAHGEEGSVQLGAKAGSEVSSEALQKIRPENLGRFFVTEPNIIFDSCSVGAQGGLAAGVAQLVGGTTWGSPTKFKGIKDIVVSGTPERLEFSITPNEDVELNTYKG